MPFRKGIRLTCSFRLTRGGEGPSQPRSPCPLRVKQGQITSPGELPAFFEESGLVTYAPRSAGYPCARFGNHPVAISLERGAARRLRSSGASRLRRPEAVGVRLHEG